jgi:hypothetical protein
VRIQDVCAGTFGVLVVATLTAVILISGIAATFYNTKATSRGAGVSKTDPIASEV